MLILIGFGFLAGVGTALSPCVLPVLPVALAAGTSGGRRRPLGIVTGVVVSFTFAVVALVYVIEALGLPDDLVRNFAIAVLLVFGLSLLVPAASARLEAWLTRLNRRGPRAGVGDGFGSGLLIGGSLGFVYFPCAGPILAGVITVSASQSFTAGRLAVALAYSAGSALVLYGLMLGGRRVSSRLSRWSGRFQQAMGVVMVLAAVAMFANLDTRFQTAIADDLPDFLVNPTKELEETEAVRRGLADIRGRKAGRQRGGAEAARGRRLPVLGRAPDFADTQGWFNTPGGRSLSLDRLRGRVVLIDFWTYTCINCLRTLPYIKAWDAKYRRDGLTVVGVHTPEFPFERKASNVRAAIAQNGLRYPVAQDNEYGTWNAYRNQYWPAKYLIDSRGRLRYTHFGEGEYGTTEKAIRSLLAEAGAARLGQDAKARVEVASHGVTTPETYLGAARAERFANGPIRSGAHRYGLRFAPGELPRDHLAYSGAWRITPDGATSRAGARLLLRFGARRVFLVLGSSRPRTLRVLLDGRPVTAAAAGRDVRGGAVRVRAQRLYRLIDLPRAGTHLLDLRFQPGISGFAFTFG
jgi:cytochrome c biogenesis protein CcdA/thiol-disulfide isomerase/thioredoxin